MGSFGPKFPENVDELHLEVLGVIKDVDRLNALFDLFAAVLNQLCRIESVYKQEPDVRFQVLGRVQSNSGVSPGGAEAVVGVTERRGTREPVRRTYVRWRKIERTAPHETNRLIA